MKVNFFKRSIAYFIDVVIISLISNVILFSFPYNDQVLKYRSQMNDAVVNFADSKITVEKYFNTTADLSYKIEKSTVLYTVLEVIIIIGYFCLLPLKNGGMTLGKRIMGIKIIKDDKKLNLNDLIIRSFFTTNIIINLISLATIMFTNKQIYFLINEAINFVYGMAIITIIFMILYRNDKKGLHDVILKTSVVKI